MRSAFFLPMPGNRDETPRVAVGDRVLEVGGVHAGEHPERDLRTDGRHLEQQQEERALVGVEEAVELERVLAHVGVDVELHLRARDSAGGRTRSARRRAGSRRRRRRRRSAPAPSRGGVRGAARSSPARVARCARATGAASAVRRDDCEVAERDRERVGRVGDEPLRRRAARATIARCTCSFSARPVPVTASFTVAGRTRRSAMPADAAASIATPRTSPEAKRALDVPADEALLERHHVGTPLGAELDERRVDGGELRGERHARVGGDGAVREVRDAAARGARPAPQPVTAVPGSTPSTRTGSARLSPPLIAPPRSPPRAAARGRTRHALSRSTSSCGMSTLADTFCTSS